MKDKLILPTKEQAAWADAEVGVIIHYDLTSFHPGYDQESLGRRYPGFGL